MMGTIYILSWFIIGLISIVFLLCLDGIDGALYKESKLRLFGTAMFFSILAPIPLVVAIYAAKCEYQNYTFYKRLQDNIEKVSG